MAEHNIILVHNNELSFCTVCKGGEGSLTTECCGRKLTEEEEQKIYYEGTLDFRNGQWVDLPGRKKFSSTN